MSLINELKRQQIEARKNRDALVALLLTTLIGESERVGKDKGNRAPTDEEIHAVVRKFLKGNDECIAHEKDSAKLTNLERERSVLASLLPKQVEGDELMAAIKEAASTSKNVGEVMKALKERFGSNFDAKAASALAAKALA